MKLSSAIEKWLAKGIPRDEALEKAKAKIRGVNKRWAKSNQMLFDRIWGSSGKANVSTKKVVAQPPPKINNSTITAISPEKKLKYYESLLSECKFGHDAWNKYGLHYRAIGVTELPSNIKKAVSILKKNGFEQTYTSPMSADFADLNSERMNTVYKNHETGDAVNTVVQKSKNGKSDFCIINIVFKLTDTDKGRLDQYESVLNKKYDGAQTKIAKGLLKQNYNKEKLPYEMSLKEFITNAKGTNLLREGIREYGTDVAKEQWILAIETAIENKKQVPSAVLHEYTALTKSAGAIFKLPTVAGKYNPVTLTTEQITKIISNLKYKKIARLKSDDGTVFTLAPMEIENGVPCGKVLKEALKSKVLYSYRGKL